MKIYNSLHETVKRLEAKEIPASRKEVLNPLVTYVSDKLREGEPANLNFICTHNSRRSQFAQVWAYLAANWYGLDLNSFSGGVEVTSFNANAIHALEKAGFVMQIDDPGIPNSTCLVKFNKENSPLHTFSKLYDHQINPKENFAAVMTCSEADENCPFIPGTDERIPLLYDDPKVFDNTAEQDSKYLERSEQIGSELLYAFGTVRRNLD